MDCATHMKRAGAVVLYPGAQRRPPHEMASHAHVAQRLARFMELDYGGIYDPTVPYCERVYFVPSDTLMAQDEAKRLGVRSTNDLFGGVAPYSFVPTKAITHPLLDEHAQAPVGWSHAFARRVRGSVLRGITAFASEDAWQAGLQLLRHGPVRVKPVLATAGRGQRVADDAATLRAVLAAQDPDDMRRCGLVLEEHLNDVRTYSVGQITVDGVSATYCGTQRLTTDHQGVEVYGGSSLLIAQGGFDALLSLDLDQAARQAVQQARVYDTAALRCFPGLYASRRNYDVAQGSDAAGQSRSGVLEQSWRVGGASSAEVAALHEFRTHPELRALWARSVEIYSDATAAPADAQIVYSGVDTDVGLITKYSVVEPYADT